MKYAGFICALGLTVLQLHSRALDLSPHFSDTFDNGAVTRQLFFVDRDGTKCGVCLNYETMAEAGTGGTVFRIPRSPDIVLAVRRSPMAADEPFQGVSLERYREASRRLLPPWATDVKVCAEEAEPLTIKGWHSFRIVYSFETPTAYRRQSVTFVNLNSSEQMALIAASSEPNFDEACARMWHIIRTWHSLPVGPGKLAMEK